jgi:hypothetical protein
MVITQAAGCHDRECHTTEREAGLAGNRPDNGKIKAFPDANGQRQDDKRPSEQDRS